jgi:hypothetical protein
MGVGSVGIETFAAPSGLVQRGFRTKRCDEFSLRDRQTDVLFATTQARLAGVLEGVIRGRVWKVKAEPGVGLASGAWQSQAGGGAIAIAVCFSTRTVQSTTIRRFGTVSRLAG